ncbi:methylated-DNA--[protein]-cysteine S-methyltransferase [Herbaspirillum sp. LeCh32-8]|nr:methylated-DNA--[protein]-cysteine S-methyltransferase [Herbaspirillum sp. LeCh32-8]
MKKSVSVPTPATLPAAPPASQLAAIFSAVVHTPFGGMGIRTQAGVIVEMVYLPKHYAEKDAADAAAAKAVKQIGRYMKDPQFRFKLPLADVGSDFQKRVWAAIAEIPSGQVLTYGDIARRIKSAPRAVGQACGANWFALASPCHRVTAAGGLGGFSHHDDIDGFYLDVKRWLLRHEGVEGY